MPKRKAPEPDPGAFERMARELGCDDTGADFERALRAVLPPRRAVGSAASSTDQRKPSKPNEEAADSSKGELDGHDHS